jgi:asparagine synthase (glutamine-hydrolysing)
MCGISGIINKNNRPVSFGEIKAINDKIIHRGPDAEGFYFGDFFALGNRRLSVIDLTSNANQPMSYRDRYTITYNGEIYNYIEIRNELQLLGYKFLSESDTEVILASFDYFGFDCVKKFNGMWSFALYDKTREIIFCSRDRFGVKPFYYTNLNERFVFGSEIKQIINYLADRKVNLPVLINYLVAGIEDHTQETFFQNIIKLEQAHNLIYDLKNHKYTISKYYEIRIDQEISKLDEKDSVKLYRNILDDSIRLRLRSDVKVGTCLSGGLDSSSVATIASSFYRLNSINKFTAITAKTINKAIDESHFAGMVALNADLQWHTTEPDTQDFIDNLDKIISVQEEPFGSPSVFMQYSVFEKAKELGCIVMLDGQGGDETLLGYERYYPSYLISLGLRDGIVNFFSSTQKSRLSKKELLLYCFYFIYPFIRLKRLRMKFSFIKNEFFNLIDRHCINESSRSYHDIVQLQILELMSLQLPHLLKYEDRNSMHHSIESRLPFIDYRVVETALSINNRYKIKDGWTKYLLRKVIEDIVPEEITWRKNKIGFNAPEKEWLFEINALMIDHISNSNLLGLISKEGHINKTFNKMDLRTQWRLFNVAKWEEIFNVGI